MNNMTKLIITADIHGNYGSWLTIQNLIESDDRLVIAGDLFDTKFGNYSNPDFQPELIKSDLKTFKNEYYYVYGNCDMPSFSPGFDETQSFSIFNKFFFLCHGHRPYKYSTDIDIVIQGHTHICSLYQKDTQIFINPGSITSPRNGIYTYGMIDKTSANIIELKTGEKLATIDF